MKNSEYQRKMAAEGVEPDFEACVTVDAIAFADLARLLAEAAEVVRSIAKAHASSATGLTMAAESTVLSDLRSASRDAALFERYVGELAPSRR